MIMNLETNNYPCQICNLVSYCSLELSIRDMLHCSTIISQGKQGIRKCYLIPATPKLHTCNTCMNVCMYECMHV